MGEDTRKLRKIPRRFRLVSVDLDETLWPLSPTLERAEQELYAWLDSHAPALTARHSLDSLREQRTATLLSHPSLAHDVSAVRHRSLAVLLQEHGHAVRLADEAMAVFLAARNRVVPFTEVTGFLQNLRKRFVVASLTNGNADVRQTPLGEFIDLPLTAASAGAAKPDPKMFRMALAAAKVEPDNAMHIGDDPELDILPAKKLNMTAVWVNRSNRAWPHGLPGPDLEVKRLDADTLLHLLELNTPETGPDSLGRI